MAGLQGNAQTDYSFFPVSALAGMRYSTSASDEVVDFVVATGGCSPGQLMEDYGGQARPAQSATGTLYPIIGVCMFRDSNVAKPNTSGPSPANYLAGDRVPILRKGRIYTNWNGTTQGGLVTANYEHSSTGAHAQGSVTDAATSGTTGAEIDPLPGGIRIVRPITATGLCLLELNLPGD